MPALPEAYGNSLAQLKGNIAQARQSAASGVDKPTGVTEYQLLRNLPETLGRYLTNIAEIQAKLVGELDTGSEVE